MKKSFLFLLFVTFFAGISQSAILGNFNSRLGVDLFGKMDYQNKTLDEDFGGALSFEYLIKLGYISLGPGIEVGVKRYKFNDNNNTKLGTLLGTTVNIPIYASLQIYPLKKYPILSGIFLRGNVGHTLYYYEANLDDDTDKKGKMYYAFGAGYKFILGIFADVTYSIYEAEAEIKEGDTKIKKDITDKILRLNVGWSF